MLFVIVVEQLLVNIVSCHLGSLYNSSEVEVCFVVFRSILNLQVKNE